MGSRACSQPLLRSSNEDAETITMDTINTYDINDSVKEYDPGSPPQDKGSKRKNADDSNSLKKKLKLEREKKKSSSLVEGMIKGIETQAASANEISAKLFSSREAELQYQKDKDKVEFKWRQEELLLQQNAQKHKQMIEQAKLMSDLGYSKEEVMEYIKTFK
jgi:hypothetical protein